MDKEKTIFLTCLDKYLTGVATRSEQLLVEEYYERMSESDASIEHLSPEVEETLKATIHQNIYKSIHTNNNTVSQPRLWSLKVLKAAALLVAASAISFYFFFQDENRSNDRLPVASYDIAPGSNRALLTLSDGREINLDDATVGQIAEVSGLKIMKISDGQVVYERSGDDHLRKGNSTKLNTISTPRGGQYQVVLPDGTKVWLNSASSLRYPSAFSEAERYVEISGEAYFEVAHDQHKPFFVKSARQKIEVLGTHFNVSAYSDEENTSTTLLEGSVKIYAENEAVTVLKPSQQAVLRNNELAVGEVHGEDATAWKNGRFVFNNTDIAAVMRQVSRWYDVEIEYEQGIPKKTIGGDISKFENISELLEVLEATGGIRFKRDGRRVIVM